MDVVIRGALSHTGVMQQMLTTKRQKRETPGATELEQRLCERPRLVEEQMLLWQRLAQHTITSTFGVHMPPTPPTRTSLGEPWRDTDPLEETRQAYLRQKGLKEEEDMTASLLLLATLGERKQALLDAMLDLEGYLRTGELRTGQRLAPTNDDASASECRPHFQSILATQINDCVVNDLARRVPGAQLNKVDPSSAYVKALSARLNVTAVVSSVADFVNLLIKGPQLHVEQSISAYLVSPSQTFACCECGEQVHVLSNKLFSNAHSACSACHTARCTKCAELYGRALERLSKPFNSQVGKACEACGAPPADVWCKRVVRDGVATVDIVVGDRRSTAEPSGFVSEDLSQA